MISHYYIKLQAKCGSNIYKSCTIKMLKNLNEHCCSIFRCDNKIKSSRLCTISFRILNERQSLHPPIFQIWRNKVLRIKILISRALCSNCYASSYETKYKIAQDPKLKSHWKETKPKKSISSSRSVRTVTQIHCRIVGGFGRHLRLVELMESSSDLKAFGFAPIALFFFFFCCCWAKARLASAG